MISTIKVKGMSCSHCVGAVSKALSGIEGVKQINIDLKKGEATFESDNSVDLDRVKREIEKAGYELG